MVQTQSVNTVNNNNADIKNPLATMSELLQEDMREVNRIILENMQSDVALIPQLAQYLIAAGGKRIRPLLTLASTSVFNGPMDKSYHLAAAVEFIHTATLLHDDVVDESLERRGQQAANLIFGNQASVLVGDFLFSKSFQMMVTSGSLEILSILSDAAAIIAQGEVLQLSTTNDVDTTLESYLKVIESKTAALFAASCEVGPVLSGASEEERAAMKRYGTDIGIAFQIIDDALDYNADQTKLGKEIGDDFREGKMTAPVIFAIQSGSDEEKDFWQRTLGDKAQSDGDFDQALTLIRKHQSFDKTMNLAKQYARDAKSALVNVPNGPYKVLLADLTDYVLSRSS